MNHNHSTREFQSRKIKRRFRQDNVSLTTEANEQENSHWKVLNKKKQTQTTADPDLPQKSSIFFLLNKKPCFNAKHKYIPPKAALGVQR